MDGHWLWTAFDEAGTRALRAQLRQWQAHAPGLGLLALVAEASQAQIAPLQGLCRELGLPLHGAVFPALVSDTGFLTEGVCLLRFDEAPPTLLLPQLPADADAAADQLVRAVQPALARHADASQLPTLFLVFDAMLPHIGTILDQTYNRLKHRTTYAGVNAGSERFCPMPCLFDAQQCVDGGVLALVLPPQHGSAVRHGYPVAKSLMRATSTAGNRIATLDGRPAFEVYQEVIAKDWGVQLTQDNFYDYAVHYPFGVVMALDVLVRIPVGFLADQSIICVGEIAPDSMLKLLRAPTLEDSGCVAELARLLPPAAASSPPPPMLTFYCAGRRMHFGEQAQAELLALRAHAAHGPLLGALTLGEIDSTEVCDLGFPRFHNAAIACVW